MNVGHLFRRSLQSGMTVIELLVAMLIALVSTIVIFQTFSVAEGYKRSTSSGGDAQSTAALALHTLDREIRRAGYSVNMPEFFGCKIRACDNELSLCTSPPAPPQIPGGPQTTLPDMRLDPIAITQGTGEVVVGGAPTIVGAPDSIAIVAGSNDATPTPARLISTMTSPTADFTTSNPYGFSPGDLVLAVELNKDCTIAQVSKVTGNQVEHMPGTYSPAGGGTQNIRYNQSSGLGVTYNANDARLYNLGQSPRARSFSLLNDQLLVQDGLATSSTLPAPLFDNVVQLQAEYGKDTNGDGVVDQFDAVKPTNQAEWRQVVAVRIVLVTRAGQYEKDEVSAASILLWPRSTVAPTTAGAQWNLTSDQRHYRYKVLHTIVPVRNLIWRPT
jgi:type IV pilus assembly protein PilW